MKSSSAYTDERAFAGRGRDVAPL